MSVLGASNPTLMDVASRSDAEGKITTIVELLSETNEIISDMSFIECNNGTTHKTTVRTGLPSATWRMLNYGVQSSKSRTAQVSDATGMLEAYAEVDKALADLNGNTSEFRASEDKAFLEAMNQEFANVLFYGNTSTDPEKFLGLAYRFNSLSAENGQNIISGGGSGSDNTSVWLLVWGPSTIHGIYPKGSKAGLSHRDLGEQTLEDANGGKYQGYRTHYKWDCGLTLRDWRYVVRIANIDVSDLTKTGSTGADLVDLMVQAIEKIPNIGMGRAVFYCNRTVSSYLRRQIANKDNVNLSLDEVAGKKVLTFDGIPVRRCDAILNTESAVS
jgi:hypothetical protein